MSTAAERMSMGFEALRVGDFVRARVLLGEAVELFAAHDADVHPRLDALMGLAAATAAGHVEPCQELEAAVDVQKRAVALLDRFPVDEERAASVLFRHAAALLNLHKTADAVPIALRAVEVARRPTPMARLHLSLLAAALAENGEREVALPFARAAVAFGRDLDGSADLVDLLLLAEILGEGSHREELVAVLTEIVSRLRAEEPPSKEAIRHFETLLANTR